MANFKQVEVIKPFHLPLEDYQRIFSDIKPRGNGVGIVVLNAVKSVSGIILNEKKDVVKQVVNVGLLRRGYMAIWKGDGERAEQIEIGKFYGTRPQAGHSVIYTEDRKIVCKGVFPRVRHYTYMIFDEMDLALSIDRPAVDELHGVMMDANVDKEKEDYLAHLAELEKQDLDANLFSNGITESSAS